MADKVSSGSEVLDELLDGGYEENVITTIYGPSGSGKTNLCMLCMAESIEKKIIYIDTEASFSIERLKQVSDDYKDVLERTVFLRPVNFKEQRVAFEKLREIVTKKTGLIVLDTVAMLYRLEVGLSDSIYDVNRELGLQIAYLTEIARKKKIPVLITNQVYADFDSPDEVNLVGGDILKYGSKCLIELKKVKNSREAVIRKHRSIEEGRSRRFRIVQDGIEPVDE